MFNRFNLKKIVGALLVLQISALAIIILYLLFWQGPIVIGAGKFQHVVNQIETTDYRWWIAIGCGLYLVVATTLFILFVLVDISNWQLEEIKKHFYALIKDKHIPVTVDINEFIPIHLEKPVNAPFSINTLINFNQEVSVQANIPVKMDLPIDTVVETSVMGLGKIRIPIKTTLPIDMIFPFVGNVHMKVDNFKFSLSEMAQVQLPAIEVPVRCQVRANLNIQSNLQQVEKLIKAKLPNQ